MEHRVTFVEHSYFSPGVKQQTLERMNAHVAEMSADGWQLVSTAAPEQSESPLVLFWRRD